MKLKIFYLTLFSISLFSFSQNRPNIVIIIADDMGYGEVQALNPERSIVPTPNLDRLVQEGMTFTDGHSGSSVCTPSRYSLMTGRYSWRTLRAAGVGKGPKSYGGCMIPADRMTIGNLVRNQGYNTSYIGKWHLGFSTPGARQTIIEDEFAKDFARTKLPSIGSKAENTPYSRGFDYFYGYDNSGNLNTHVENDKVVKHCQSSLVLSTLAEKAVEYVDNVGNNNPYQPFLLYVAINSPHLPIVPSEKWIGKSKLGLYGDFLMETDWAVGEIVNSLRNQNLLDNTMLFFSADNGYCPVADKINAASRADKKTFKELGHFPSGINRGDKADLYEGGHRVPFLLRWPQGNVKQGSQCDEMVSLIDFMATFSELLGADYPDNVGEDALSMLPAIRGEKGLRNNLVHQTLKGNLAIRQNDWKMLFPGSKNPKIKANPEVYNLSTDRTESKNLYGKNREQEAELVNCIEDVIKDGRSSPGEPQAMEREIDYRTTPRENIVGEGLNKAHR